MPTRTIDATSITTFDETRDGHLQSPDFFDTTRWTAIIETDERNDQRVSFHGLMQRRHLAGI